LRKGRTILWLLVVLLPLCSRAQYPSFSHLNTSNGLSENTVQSLAIDRNGFLWIGTVDGLNIYDGYSVTTYRRDDRPEMASNNVIHLTCDSRNRLWLGTPSGITMVDERRKFHRIVLNDTVSNFASRTIMDTKVYGPVLFTSLGQYYFDEQKKKWERLHWIPELLRYHRFNDAEPFEDNKIIYATDSLVLIMDYGAKKIVYDQPFEKVVSLCRFSDYELAIGQQNGLVQIVDIRTKQITRKYQLTSILNKKTINSTITEVRKAPNGDLLVGTGFSGITIIDKEGKLTSYTHDPINPRSIAGNITWRVLGSASGDMIVGTNTAGVSMFNIYNKQAGYIKVFGDIDGNYYDSYVTEMAEDERGNIWIGALERVIRWNRATNRMKFFYYYSPQPIHTGAQSIEIRSLCVDKSGRVWVSALGDGLAILNEETAQFKKIVPDSTLGPAAASRSITDLYCARNGNIWVGTVAGFYTINPGSLKVNTYLDHPALKEISGKRINSFIEDRHDRVWMATYDGIYIYDPKTDSLTHLTTKEGLAATRIFTLYEDRNGNIYAGSFAGFNIIRPNGTIEKYGKEEGLKYDYVAGTLEDNKGNIWISNRKCVVKFNPANGNMEYFDQNVGLSDEGFRIGSFLRTRDGDMFFGSRAGVNYFTPGQLVSHPSVLKVHIYQADTGDSTVFLPGNETFAMDYADNSVIFRFAAINLKGSRNVFYRYILFGHEKNWQSGTDIKEARYSSLPPGTYVFRVKASIDGINWIDSNNTITLGIVAPFWQRWWFILLSALVLVIGTIAFIRNRNKKIRQQREALETEQAINYFATSLNEQQTVETILWDVARNCIGRLQFEDCVIYLIDEERGVLMQKAAHGPKSPQHYEISSPIEIPLGKGIVGSVALTGKAEMIADTSKDPRYIVDDQLRYSEISVPIMSDGKVLGVIDCEHSKKAFFTQRHLSIITTIASLCANKIVKANAEAEKREAERILMDTQQKMSEVEMQALRAQMNPHFIFNCLNSINRYIVKSDQATASLYLTKFAKLIRLILDNSNTQNVILSNELEALKLYIDMESLRFDKKFSYSIEVDPSVRIDSVEVPPLIIQPYVENAIWHGLLHKQTAGHLAIRISMPTEGMLQCVIEDDGVGREKARELRSKTATTKKSLGMKLTENRLALLNKHAELNASVEIIDVYRGENGSSHAAGTKVILNIPV
jgi:ligand-binding sensor domain-containing protein/putative methionine-R-sulfoxide reductase with GAF domain